MDESNYKLKLRATSMYQILLALLIIVIGIMSTQDAQQSVLFSIIYIFLGVFLIFRYFNMPKEIIVDSELVTFKNWFGKEKAAYITDLKRIQKKMSYITITTEEKRIIMPSGFNDFNKFTEDMKKRNPGVEVVGIKL